jgi:hypothetical protein
MLKIKDGVCRLPLCEEVLLLLQFDHSSAKTGVGEENGKIECGVARIGRQLVSPSMYPESGTWITGIDPKGHSSFFKGEKGIPHSLTRNSGSESLPWRRAATFGTCFGHYRPLYKCLAKRRLD